MDLSFFRSTTFSQFSAAIEALERAIVACPDDLWGDRSKKPEFWYTAFHAIFFLDLYLSPSDKGFVPPPPFTLDEMDERGLMPERVYSKKELLDYLAHGREKCRKRVAELREDEAVQRCGFDWLDINVAELLLYNMRHVQHHAAQLNTLLSQSGLTPPRWVRKG